MIKKRPVTPREIAAFTLFSMQEDKAWSDGALHYYQQRADLSPRDAALAAQLVYGVLQNSAMCDFYLTQFSKIRLKKLSPRVHSCLRLGIYQLTMLERIPAHAAVSQTVDLVKNYAHADERTIGYVNGVLRAVARAAEQKQLPALNCPDKESYYACRYSHPEWLVRKLSAQYGVKQAGLFCAANNQTAPLSLRVNTDRISIASALTLLQQAGFAPRPHKTINNVILCERGNIAALPLFQEGSITVQDGAGVTCVDVLAPQEGMRILDCCAAPGGKSFYLAEKLKNKGKVMACDIYAHKLDKIKEGAQRLGLENIEVRLQNAAEYQQEFADMADAVLCDVPCSGFGIIRKKPEIRQKTDEETAGLPEIQLQILRNCARYVKKDGVLVYSTCTILQRENQEVIQAFLTEHTAFALEAFTHPACGECQSGFVTLLPHIHDTDGFFIAKLRRIK